VGELPADVAAAARESKDRLPECRHPAGRATDTMYCCAGFVVSPAITPGHVGASAAIRQNVTQVTA
jgi:hypothetical protein